MLLRSVVVVVVDVDVLLIVLFLLLHNNNQCDKLVSTCGVHLKSTLETCFFLLYSITAITTNIYITARRRRCKTTTA